jgi:hypothetical protein
MHICTKPEKEMAATRPIIWPYGSDTNSGRFQHGKYDHNAFEIASNANRTLIEHGKTKPLNRSKGDAERRTAQVYRQQAIDG